MTISEITTAVQPLEIINKLNETIPVVNASVADATLSTTSTNAIQNKAVTIALNTKQNSATAVTHTATTAVGDTTTPVYITSGGVATALSYSIAKSVPADAVFTDTTYSQGSGISISDNTISNSGVRSISQGSANGTILVNTGGVSADVTIKGLGTSAFQNVSSSYSPTGTTVINGTAVAGALSPIEALIPAEATSNNQLADKTFVNNSISTNTANFIGTFQSVEALEAYSGTVTNNDYAFVETTDSAGNSFYDRYKYSGSSWLFEFEINNTTFTTSQWGAINSGVTNETKVTHTATTAVGDTTTPVYISSNGAATALSYSIAKSVPADAVFTDTTYSDFVGSDSITAGASGLVPAPSAGDEGKFLKGSGAFSALLSSDITTALGFIPYNSTNPNNYVTSSALSDYQLIDQPVNVLATSGTITLTDNSVNSITPSDAVTFTLPTITDNTVFHQILVQVNLTTVYSLTLGTSYFFNSTAPNMSNVGVYNLIYEYDKANQYWVVGCVEKGAEE